MRCIIEKLNILRLTFSFEAWFLLDAFKHLVESAGRLVPLLRSFPLALVLKSLLEHFSGGLLLLVPLHELLLSHLLVLFFVVQVLAVFVFAMLYEIFDEV